MSESIGRVSSGSNRNSIIVFSKNNIRSDYISVEEEQGKRFLFEISGIESINERLADIEYFRLMLISDDYNQYTIYKMEAKPVGAIENGKVAFDRFYIAPPGSSVYIADYDDVKLLLDIAEKENRLKIGTLLRMTDISVYIDFEKLFRTHCSFLGRTGSGKTYFMKKLLEKINMDFLIISPTDEYDSLTVVKKKNIKSYREISLRFNINKMKKILNLNYSELDYLRKFIDDNKDIGIINSLDLSERMALFFTKPDSFFSRQGELFSDNISAKKSNMPQYAGSLCAKFAGIDIFLNFEKEDNSDELPMVINTQDFSPELETMIVYSFLIDLLEKRKRMFNSNKRDMRDILIVLEEAHNYAPSVRTVICKDAVIRLAREGRKYGLHLLILSQRPRYIDPTLLSQCGGNIIFNLPNPDDIEYIMNNSGFYNESYCRIIQNFKTGDCLIASNIRETDIMCHISI